MFLARSIHVFYVFSALLVHRPLDRAVWWLEFLLRHPKAAQQLRSPVHDLTWYRKSKQDKRSLPPPFLKKYFASVRYQYFLLDVIAFLAISLSLLALVLWKLVK